MLNTEPLFCWYVVSLQDINMRKAFKSSTVHDQQVLSKDSASNSVAELYNSCDRPPPLNTLTEYRWNTKLPCAESFSCWTFLSNTSFMFVFITQTRFHRCDDVLLRPFILLWNVEGENASGHRGQEERETEAEGESAVEIYYLVVWFVWWVDSFFITFHGSRNRNEAWKAAPLSTMWRRWEKPETEGRSGTWWRWTKNFGQITAIRRVSIVGHHLRAPSHQTEGKNSFFFSL